jgi:hypothetical protein
MGKSDKEFEVVVQSKRSQVRLPIKARDAAQAEALAAPIIRRRQLGAIIQTKEKPKK